MSSENPTDIAPAANVRAAFAVGGEMGTLIRAIDWSKSALGPIESWPAELRSTVSLALGSTSPISIVWGSGHVQIYNDGYRPICGAKHPASMGQDFRECWASAFPIIGAAYDRAWSGQADYLENQRMFLDRHGFLEETFFTFSFSPIRNEAGHVAGLFHPVTETTVQMLSERRIRCLRDLAAHAGKAKTIEEGYDLAAKTLAEFDLDLPFVRLYRLSRDGLWLDLEASTGLRSGGEPPAASLEIASEPDRGWPFAAALDSERGIEVDDLERRIGSLACGPYPESPRAALVLPIRIAGVEQPHGILVAGVSPRLPLDAAYRDFFDLLVNAIAVVIGNARASEQERTRAQALAEIDQVKQDMTVAARRRLHSLLMDAPAVMCSLRGPELIVELANAKLLQLWGRDSSVIGKPLLQATPEVADQPFPALLREVIRTGVPFVANESLARVDTARDGVLRDIYFDFIYAPTREDDGSVSGVLVFAVDVTQQVVIRRELEAALGDARNANRAKDEFLALLGHELRNPLAPITTALEMIELRGYAGVEKEVAVIGRQTEHLSHLVDDLLDVSRITSGKVDLDRRAIDLAEIVTTSVELASPLFEQKQHHLDVDVSVGLVVNVDPKRMAQVLANLLTNAAKYTEPRGSIVLAAAVDGEHVVISVRDNGTGIAPEMLPHVFDMFTQERRSVDQSRGGLGLGLTIVKSLVVQHGGSVSAHSDGRGTGSRFEVRLPRVRESAKTLARPRLPRSAITKSPRRVLIVDDNEDAARMLADAIGALGHDTRIAFDGPSALKVIEIFTPELALLDLGLPAMDGYELGRKLKETERLSALRLIAVTGYGQPSDRKRSQESGFDAHLVKPIDVRGLASLIDDLLRV